MPHAQRSGVNLHEIPKKAQDLQLNPHYSLFSALYSLSLGIVFRCFVQTIPPKPKKRDSAGGARQQKTPLDAASVCPWGDSNSPF